MLMDIDYKNFQFQLVDLQTYHIAKNGERSKTSTYYNFMIADKADYLLLPIYNLSLNSRVVPGPEHDP